MRTIHSATELKSGNRKVCLAIGFFDGVHLGHQQIIRQTIADAQQHEAVALVVTFDRHPNTVVAPHRVPPLIYSLPQKLRAISSLDVDTLLLLHFDQSFSEQTGEQFIRRLARDLGKLQSLCVGANFVFGFKRSGDVALLKRLGAELKFTVHGMASLALDGQAVSSTRIREAIRAGDLDAAGQMLGRAYAIAGPVVAGDKQGRQLGFPTANIDAQGLALPPTGVYAVRAQTGGKAHRAALNIGYRPTFQPESPRLCVEVHLVDFEDDLYGKEIEVTFVEKLRDERKFSSVLELQQQIAKDVEAVRRSF
jgi:riboflavin kinase/FMN adenylyltransferase